MRLAGRVENVEERDQKKLRIFLDSTSVSYFLTCIIPHVLYVWFDGLMLGLKLRVTSEWYEIPNNYQTIKPKTIATSWIGSSWTPWDTLVAQIGMNCQTLWKPQKSGDGYKKGETFLCFVLLPRIVIQVGEQTHKCVSFKMLSRLLKWVWSNCRVWNFRHSSCHGKPNWKPVSMYCLALSSCTTKKLNFRRAHELQKCTLLTDVGSRTSQEKRRINPH